MIDLFARCWTRWMANGAQEVDPTPRAWEPPAPLDKPGAALDIDPDYPPTPYRDDAISQAAERLLSL